MKKSAFISLIVTIVFFSVGITLSLNGYSSLGMALFFFLPFAVGMSSGLLPDPKYALTGLVIGALIFGLGVLLTKAEGIICLLMALPIIGIAIAIGWLFGKMFKAIRKKNKTNLKVTLAPFLLFLIANFFEMFSGSSFYDSSVSTTTELNASKSMVYNSIIKVDTVDVKTHLLQDLGLPIPRKCVLTEEKVGGLRFCEFEEGRIVEEIVEIEKNEFLRMKVVSCDLGKERSWLKFKEDIYQINSSMNGNTQITRTTTYKSNLKPRAYWELMEEITIRIEQDFVFRNLQKDILTK